MAFVVHDRFHPRLQQALQARIEAGELRKQDELALLDDPVQLRLLARGSFFLLLGAGVFFGGLDLWSLAWHGYPLAGSLNILGFLLWFVLNIVSYLLILPFHELVHGGVFLLWGGRPYFGAKLPLALYCGAKEQLFRRNHYLVVGLAPLIVISSLAILITLLAPLLSAYLLLAWIGNASGAVGDLLVAQRLRKCSPETLIEDTETGYRAWTF
ncbi:DUF3267 domain-containing protein [Tengunoibacter tsumagoiensis]|uniref:DUF3267 domain-containing protein n=1 Tax=Tengunoibacter tsumagoiensis TaxID=2014871 RepID=A0A402A392_9CHLR|nr:DUF3267 domain-containing protein [Tengunoibacter tsumagoiensis]GCE13542.1 hypothetical protein KTT_34010 [Tengunoibacter tsumagoiensis]